MKKKQMQTTQIETPKEILVQFRIPEEVAMELRVLAARNRFSTLTGFMKHTVKELVSKQ